MDTAFCVIEMLDQDLGIKLCDLAYEHNTLFQFR